MFFGIQQQENNIYKIKWRKKKKNFLKKQDVYLITFHFMPIFKNMIMQQLQILILMIKKNGIRQMKQCQQKSSNNNFLIFIIYT